MLILETLNLDFYFIKMFFQFALIFHLILSTFFYLKVNHVSRVPIVTTSSSTSASIQLQFNGVAVFIIKFEVFHLKTVCMEDLLNWQFAIKCYCQKWQFYILPGLVVSNQRPSRYLITRFLCWHLTFYIVVQF